MTASDRAMTRRTSSARNRRASNVPGSASLMRQTV